MNEPRGEYKHYQVVAYVSPEIRDLIGKHGNWLHIRLESVIIYDGFYLKRCNKCNLFGHYKENCDKPISCGLCSAENQHEIQACPTKDTATQDQHQCINCMIAGQSGLGHSASWIKCPAYIAAQRRLRSQIPYYEGLKYQN